MPMESWGSRRMAPNGVSRRSAALALLCLGLAAGCGIFGGGNPGGNPGGQTGETFSDVVSPPDWVVGHWVQFVQQFARDDVAHPSDFTISPVDVVFTDNAGTRYDLSAELAASTSTLSSSTSGDAG
jgi:hypothetical protein